MTQDTQKQTGWIDAMRLTACLLVVLAHCCDPFVAHFDTDHSAFTTGVFTGSLTRPCVPLFAMITGALLLPIKQGTPLVSFYKKRIGRLVAPLLFWSLALPVITFCYFCFINPETTNPQLSVGDYTLRNLLERMCTFIFNFNFDTTPLWYLYMLIGLYIVMPILSTWLAQASGREIKTLLCIWGFTLLIPYLQWIAPSVGYQGNYGNMGLFGVCDWNIYGTFHYVSGFIGYIILGYYLRRFPLQWSAKKTAIICLPIFLAGYAITSVGYITTNEYFPGNYAYLEIVWYFTGINVFAMTFPVFVTIQKADAKPRPLLSRIARLTFGIYLCHFAFTFMAYDIFEQTPLPFLVRIICAAIVTFAISAIIVLAMSKTKFTEIFIK